MKVDFAKDYEEMISDERCREAMDSFHKDKAEVYAPYVLDGKLEKDLELSRAILRQDFRCFRHELAGSIGGALYLMLRGKDIESVVAEARKCFEKTARSCLTRSEQTGEGKTGGEQEERFALLAHAAHYADEFFGQLSGILGHDRVLKLNRVFFRLWDGEKQNGEMSAFLENLRKESERKESKLKNTLLKSYWDDPELREWWEENEKKQGIEGLNRVLDFKLSEFWGKILSDVLRKELKLDIARQIFGDDKDRMERFKEIPGWNKEEVESKWKL